MINLEKPHELSIPVLELTYNQEQDPVPHTPAPSLPPSLSSPLLPSLRPSLPPRNLRCRSPATQTSRGYLCWDQLRKKQPWSLSWGKALLIGIIAQCILWHLIALFFMTAQRWGASYPFLNPMQCFWKHVGPWLTHGDGKWCLGAKHGHPTSRCRASRHPPNGALLGVRLSLWASHFTP